ncbi:BA75_02304T0 [Komagataella pastoris]|uniref:BA75_02304T0 n=1 Tax=Komagataella pastoris TaxID=4922 RepID=A0A1B2JAT2_PICPA|nr:BA75_02304T0 [Komagataella pastoris]
MSQIITDMKQLELLSASPRLPTRVRIIAVITSYTPNGNLYFHPAFKTEEQEFFVTIDTPTLASLPHECVRKGTYVNIDAYYKGDQKELQCIAVEPLMDPQTLNEINTVQILNRISSLNELSFLI